MQFKTYGAMLDSLCVVLAEASTLAYQEYYGTPSYLKERALRIHRAYDAWCAEHGILDRESLRIAIAEHIRGSQHQNHGGLRSLCDILPAEFNVRGRWTSEQDCFN